MTFVLVVLLLAPSVTASSPVPNLPSAFSLGGQDVTDLSMDPSGEFAVGVVSVDPAGLGGPLPAPTGTRHDDIYPCDFGPVASVGAGSGCRNPGLQHATTRRTTTLGAAQVVDYTSFTSSSGVSARFVVGGPSDTLSLWSSTEDLSRWEFQVPGNQAILNVSIAPDASRVVIGTAPANAGTPGAFAMVNASGSTGSNGVVDWTYPFSDSRPSSIDYARAGTVVVVGTASMTTTANGNIFLFKPTGSKPTANVDLFTFQTGGDVSHALLSNSGNFLVVGTTQGIFFVPVDPVTANPSTNRWVRAVAGGCQRVAISQDGERYAGACGTQLRFFKHRNDTFIGEDNGFFDAGAPVADLAYDATGQLLVAIAGNRVYGFGPNKVDPIWSFDATEAGNGGLDGPLRKVTLSSGGERFVVAGKTRILPYRTIVTASAVFVEPQQLPVQPATNVRLSFTVTNKGSMADNYTFSAHFPPAWNGFSPDPVKLDPEQSATVNFSFDVPAAQPPGFYGVSVDVRSETLLRLGRASTVVATPTLNLTVPRSVVLNVTTSDDRVPPLRQGSEVTLPVTIRNRGNALGVVNLSTTQELSRGAPWQVRFQADQVEVPAGGERTVNLVVAAPTDATSGDRNDITICAREGTPKTCQKDNTPQEAMKKVTAYVDPKFGAELSTNASTFDFGPGELKVVTVRVLNTGNTEDSYNLTYSIVPTSVQNDWRVTLERDFLKLGRGEARSVTVTVRAAVTDPRDATLIVRAISIGSGSTEDSSLSLALVPRPLTTTTVKSPIPAPDLALVLGLVVVASLAVRRRIGGR